MSTEIASPAPSTSIPYSYGVGVRDIRPKQRVAASFAEFSRAIHDSPGPAVPAGVLDGGKPVISLWKNTAPLPWFTAPMAGDGTRNGGNVQPWPVFVADIDEVEKVNDQLPAEVLLDFVCAMRKLAPCFGYTTTSHTDTHPRARMVLHLSRPVDVWEAKCLAGVLSSDLSNMLGLSVGMAQATVVLDASMQDASHFAFGPLQGSNAIDLCEDVPPLDVNAYLARVPRATPRVERDAWFVGRAYSPEAEKALREALVRLDQRHPEVVNNRKDWLRVLAALKAHDWPDDVMEPIARSWSSTSPKYEPERFETDWDSLEPKGDITASTLYYLAGQAQEHPREQTGHLSEIDLSDVMSSEMPELGFLLPPLLPRGLVTLLGGHGGVGKSMFALEIAIHLAAGKSFAGFPVEVPQRVVFISLEDDRSVALPRLRHIVEHFNIPATVFQNLRIFDFTGAFGALMTEVSGGGLESTALMAEVEAAAATADLVVIDNASEAFDGNENVRRHVRQFFGALKVVAKANNSAILLLAHIDKASAKSGSRDNSYSGSTAWHNSSRSRIALLADAKGIELRHEKTNHGVFAKPVRLVRGGFGVLELLRQADHVQGDQVADQMVLEALISAAELGITVPTTTTGGRTSSHALIEAGLPGPLREEKRRVEDALRSLEAAGLILRAMRKNTSRKLAQVWEFGLA